MIQMRRPEDALYEFQTAWNSHDMESFGALFHEDATFVNRFGHYVRGVEAIIKLHAPIHATIYSDSTNWLRVSTEILQRALEQA
jgi:uncharacterized protein (TIGR02246 family)